MNFSGMLMYFLLAGLMMLATIAAEFANKKWIKIALYASQLTVIFLVCVLKANSVGTDTAAYENAFIASKEKGKLASSKDVGFYAILLVASKILPNFFSFQIIFYLFAISAYGATFYFLSKKPHLCLAVLLGTPLFLMLLSGMRQTLAITVCCTSIIVFLKAKKWWKLTALPIYILAYFFHQSALIFILFYVCHFLRISRRSGFVLILVYVVFLTLGEHILSVIYSFADMPYYITSVRLGLPVNSLLFFIILLISGFVFAYYHILYKATPALWGVYLYCLLMSTSSYSHIFSRFAFFFAPAIPLLVADAVATTIEKQPVAILERKAPQVILIGAVMAVFSALAIYDLCFTNSMGTYPYAFRF